MSAEWETAGEALVRRSLERDEKLPDHFAVGQHHARRLDTNDSNIQACELSFVNALGFAMLVPLVRMDDREWEPAGVQRAGGVFMLLAPMRVARRFKMTAKMKAAIREMEERDE